MADFDTAGFSAVENFFGDDDGGGNEAPSKKSDTPTKPQPKTKRRGVGSAAPPKTERFDLSNRLLKVGKKRSREDPEDEIDNQSDQDDDDDEDEMGRTGIVAPKESQAPKKDETEIGGKRKLGKKERKRLNAESESADAGEDTPSNNEESAEKTKEASKKKQKRRKVRSRQKNIYKDNREEKPQHLIPGGAKGAKSSYEGRPLTLETREKLNLPTTSKTRQPLFVVDRSPAAAETGVPLAVDDFLNGTTKKHNKKKQKSKKKYKNL